MKLGKIQTTEKTERINISLKASTSAMLEQYRTAYEAEYGEKISATALIEEILRAFIQADKTVGSK